MFGICCSLGLPWQLFVANNGLFPTGLFYDSPGTRRGGRGRGGWKRGCRIQEVGVRVHSLPPLTSKLHKSQILVEFQFLNVIWSFVKKKYRLFGSLVKDELFRGSGRARPRDLKGQDVNGVTAFFSSLSFNVWHRIIRQRSLSLICICVCTLRKQWRKCRKWNSEHIEQAIV